MRQPLRGLVGQGMDAHKSAKGMRVKLVSRPLDILAGGATATVTAPKSCQALIYLWGAGGSGAVDGGGAGCSGGGGGAALRKQVALNAGQSIVYVVGQGGAAVSDPNAGNPGTDSTVTLPGGVVLRAGGGKGGLRPGSNLLGGAGGVAQGGDVNRPGGSGGAVVSGVGQPGDSPTFGGIGGTGTSGNFACGGGAAGFSDEGGADLIGGNGANVNAAGVQPGGGGGASGAGGSGAGAHGRLYLVLFVIDG